MQLQAALLDSSRLFEKPRVYNEYLPLLAEWGYNAIVWHFTDDEGCSMRFPSHPELASPHAWSVEQTQQFIKRAARLGIDIIPEVECLGHTEYISKSYPKLADGVPGKLFGAIASTHADTRKIVRSLLEDTAKIFPSPYIHVGMDEASFGAHPLTARLLKTKKKYEIFADHVCWLHSIIQGLGKQMMMWSDHLVPQARLGNDYLDYEALSEIIADTIPKDIILCDWHYRAQADFPTLDFLLEKGFRVLACPATCAYGAFVHPRKENMTNVRNFRRSAIKRSANPAMLGTVNTVWVTQRALPGTFLAGLAVGGGLKPDAAWCGKTYGATPAQSRKIAEACALLEKASPFLHVWIRAFPANDRDMSDTTPAEARKIPAMARAGAKALSLLDAALPSVKKNLAFYKDLLFAAKVYIQAAAQFRALRTGKKADLQASLDALKKLITVSKADWNRSRFPDDFPRSGSDTTSIHQRLVSSEKYIETLLKK